MVGHAGQDNSHIHAANRCVADGVKKRARGHEIRARDPQAAGCAVNCGKINGRADAPTLGGSGGDGKDARIPSVGERGRGKAERGDFAGRVVPILQKRELESSHGRAFDPEMRVAPWAEPAAPAHVFVAHIQTAKEGNTGICDDQLAVVAEVDLEISAKLTVRDECLDGDTFAAEFFCPSRGQFF